MRRLLIPAVLVALLVPLAAADASPGDKVPTLAKVQALFPAVTGRQVSTGMPLQLQQDCISFTVAATPKKSVAGYYPEPFPIGPGGGPASATASVFTFTSSHRAHKALKKVSHYVQDCSGTHTSGAESFTVFGLADPQLADKSLAYSWRYTEVVPPNNLVLVTTTLHVVVQRDRRLVDASYATHATPPDLATMKKLAKLALKSSA